MRVIVFSFASDWLRGRRKYCGPIAIQSEVKPKQSRITFDTQLKIAPVGFLDFYNDIYEV